MDDLFEFSKNLGSSEKKKEEKSIFSVSELTRKIRNLLEYKIGEVWVEGEISNLRKQASGHQYFTLKDPNSQLPCVLFRGNASKINLDLEDGQEIEVRGEISVYEPRGNYQLIVRNAQLKGQGNLQLEFEALKKRLNDEGLFREETKNIIPSFPNTICIVTSPTGAAVRDMISVIQRRAPWVKIIVYPVLVQGSQASSQIVEALGDIEKWSNEGKISIDTIALTRGGGSLEDLWPFNEEMTARAIHKINIPIVSAIGHEIDFTISDFVADLRAPTPSAAAEILVPEKNEVNIRLNHLINKIESLTVNSIDRWKERLDYLGSKTLINQPLRFLSDLEQQVDWKSESLRSAIHEAIRSKADDLSDYSVQLSRYHPARQIEEISGKIDLLTKSLTHNLSINLKSVVERYEKGAIAIKTLGPDSVLDRGFSLTLDADGKLITSTDEVKPGDLMTTRWKNGTIKSTVQ